MAEPAAELGRVVALAMVPPTAPAPAWELAVLEGLELVALLVSHARSVVSVAARLAAPDGDATPPSSHPGAEVLSAPCPTAATEHEHRMVVATTLSASLRALVEPVRDVLQRRRWSPAIIEALALALGRTYGALAGALLFHLGAPNTGAWLLATPVRAAAGW